MEINQKLAEQNPDIYLQELAGNINNIGVLYAKNNDLVKAEEAFNSDLGINEKYPSRILMPIYDICLKLLLI
ncbi:MAG: hypothetical protein HC887_08660 [Desulfobacteraceae bacterium]|nr:hypothetical protein [Desulfobacteraceae bacterium]